MDPSMQYHLHNITDTHEEIIEPFYLRFMWLYPVLLSLGLGSSIIAVFWYIITALYRQIRSILVCSISLNMYDDTFKWVIKYIQDNQLIKDDNVLKVKQKEDQEPWWEQIFNRHKKKDPQVTFSPGAGIHRINFKGNSIWVSHTEGQTLITGYERIPQQQETLTIFSYKGKMKVLKDFIDEAVKHSLERDDNLVRIYELHRWGIGWTKVQSKKPRTMESVILDKNLANELVEDIKKFHNSVEWYADKGVPYRRGYLLYGPPGTGKTSFTEVVAGTLQMGICYLNLSGNMIDDDGLNRALNQAPAFSIILLEDIDGIFQQRESVQSKGDGKRVTFSGLLNALDGVRSQEGRILFMTTNHREKLDPALLRPGRADVQVQLNNASFLQMQKIFLKFHANQEKKALQFAKQLPELKISMAKLQGHLMKYRNNVDDCLNNVNELLDCQETALNEMTVAEWLDRLNLKNFYHHFQKQKVVEVKDLRFCGDEGKLESIFQIKEFTDKKRIISMINGEQTAKQDFEFLTVNQIRTFVSRYIIDKQLVEQIVECVPDDKSFTTFQIKDILNDYHSFEEIKSAIEKRVQQTIKHKKQGYVFDDESDEEEEEEKESDEEKKKRMGFPSYNVEKLLKEVEVYDDIKEKMEEQSIDDETFWSLGEDMYEKILELKNVGKRKRLFRRKQKIEEQHKKDFEEIEKNEKKQKNKLVIIKQKSIREKN